MQKATPMKLPIENCRRLFNFRCPKRWEALTPTVEDGVRFCPSCHKNVYLCETPADLKRRANQCVVLEVTGQYGASTLLGQVLGPIDWDNTSDNSVGIDIDSRENSTEERKTP